MFALISVPPRQQLENLIFKPTSLYLSIPDYVKSWIIRCRRTCRVADNARVLYIRHFSENHAGLQSMEAVVAKRQRSLDYRASTVLLPSQK